MTPASGGPVWGAASADLNATLLEWPAGEGPAEHVNEARDVLYVVLAGTATLTVDGEERELGAGEATIVDKGDDPGEVPIAIRVGVISLARGQILSVGTVAFDSPGTVPTRPNISRAVFPVVGGTRAYEGATGTITWTPRSRATGRVTVRLHLP